MSEFRYERIEDKPTTSVAVKFLYESVFNLPQSELHNKPIHDVLELAEIRIPGDNQYRPKVPSDSMWGMDGTRMITWAERFAEQYRAFHEGNEQHVEGTPLEELAPYGMSPAQLSICRANQIYTIEQLAMPSAKMSKALSVHGNTIIPMAQAYLENHKREDVIDEVAELRRQIEELKAAAGTSVKMLDSTDPWEGVEDAHIRELIEAETGVKPHHKTGRDTLIKQLEEFRAAKADEDKDA